MLLRPKERRSRAIDRHDGQNPDFALSKVSAGSIQDRVRIADDLPEIEERHTS